MTPNREDYIKIIYSYNEKNEKLTNKELALRLNVSAASTSEMVRKLIDSNHVFKDKDYGLKLSDMGRREAQELVRKHRLWEVFLVNHLGYSWTEVHEDAEVLEHVTSDLLSERLNKFLGEPEYCPHGSKIYGNMSQEDVITVPLSTLVVGQTGILKKVRDNSELLDYLEHIDLQLGESFEVVRVDPYEGPHYIKILDEVIPIGHKAAMEIYVQNKGDE